MRYNGFLTFLFSMVPGGGHMYMGFMKRGFQIMALFFAIFAVTVSLDAASIGVSVLLLIWFYSFFDTIHIRRAILRGQPPVDTGFVDIEIKNINGYHIGIAFLIIGFLFALRSIEQTAVQAFGPTVRFAVHQIRDFIPPALLILAGLYLVQNHRK